MTDAVVSQVPVEVIRTNTDPDAQVVQVAVEVLRPNANIRYEETLTDVADLTENALFGLPYSETVADTLASSESFAFMFKRAGVATDTIRMPDYVLVLRNKLATATDTVTIQDAVAYSYYSIANVLEGLRLHDAIAPNFTYNLTLTEAQRLQDQVQVAWNAVATDTISITEALLSLRALTVIEQLRLGDTLSPQQIISRVLTDGIRLRELLGRFFGGDISETFGFSETYLRNYRLPRTATDTLALTDSYTGALVIRATLADGVDIDDTQVLNFLYNPVISEGVHFSAAYISPNGNFTTWAVNTQTGATTEYSNYEFNSFAQSGLKYLGASSTGLYELNGDDDDGTDIIAKIKSGLLQFNGSRLTGFKAAYIGVRGEGDFVLKLVTGDGKSYNYSVQAHSMTTAKINMGKGIRARYFSFELISAGQDFDLESIEFVPMLGGRRV